MKKLMVLAVAVALCLSAAGCSRRVACDQIYAAFPNASVESIPDEPYMWIVQDGSNLYYVICYGTGTGLTPLTLSQVYPLFGSAPYKPALERR